MLDVAQSATLLILGLLSLVILLKLLAMAHKQAGRVKELEMRMKAMEKLETDESTDNDSKQETKE